METLPFLERVLPSEGYYAIIVIDAGTAPQQGFFGSVEELATACQTADANGHNVYYAYSSFQTNRSRKQVNVHLTRVLTMDIDCGSDKVGQVDKDGNPVPDKGYVDQRAGAKALGEFLRASGLPRPMIVNSGRGLHVYWVLTEDLTPDRWQPLADRLKALAQQHGFLMDPKITADSARVLRPTRTHNPKNGAEVSVLVDAPAVDVQTIQNILQHVSPTQGAPASPPTSQPVPAVGFGKHRSSQIVGSLDVEFPPRDPAVIIEKCKQVAWAVQNQDKVEEPLWYSLLGIAAYCIDPEATAKSWSNQYAGYSEAETLKKLAQWQGATTGPATCKKFQDERPKGCDMCPLRGKIKTPASIGMRYEAAPPPTVEEVPEGVNGELKLPWPFSRCRSPQGKNIIVQTVDGTDVEIAPFDLFPVGYGYDHGLGYETVHYKWHRQHAGWQDLTFRQAYLTDGNREFATSLADQGIVLGSRKQTETFQYMMRSYMDELRSIRAMTNLHSTMGWKEDFTQFVIGSRLYRRQDGAATREDVAIAAGTQRQAVEYYKLNGSAEAWSSATTLFTALPEFGFSLGVSLAAPLVAFTGLKGVVLSLVGETGAGKSLCQLVQQSVWGVPEELHFNAEYTQPALFGRIGLYGNLPMTVDETTLMKNEDVGKFVMWATQGRDRVRLNRNADEREAKTWATTVTVSTNRSMVAKLTASGHESSAQMARMVELNMPYRQVFLEGTAFGHKVHGLFCENYGHAGDLIIKEFMRIGPDGLRRMVKDRSTSFEEDYSVHFAGTERFWKMLFVVTNLALEIAENINLIRFDRRAVVEHALRGVMPMRKSMEDTQYDAFDLVMEYLRKCVDQTLIVMHTDGAKASVDSTRIPRGEPRARMDLYRKSTVEEFDRGTVLLVAQPFKEWLAAEGHDVRTVRAEIASQGGDATPRGRRFWFGKNTSLRYGQYHCDGILLTHPRMAGLLQDQQQTANDLTFGQMAAVE